MVFDIRPRSITELVVEIKISKTETITCGSWSTVDICEPRGNSNKKIVPTWINHCDTATGKSQKKQIKVNF